MSERLCLLQSQPSLQLGKRGPTFLGVERDPVRTGGWRVAVLDSVRKKVVANLDVAVPCRCDFVHHPDVHLNIGVNSDALLLRKDRPRLWEIRAHNPSDEKSIERLFEPGSPSPARSRMSSSMHDTMGRCAAPTGNREE